MPFRSLRLRVVEIESSKLEAVAGESCSSTHWLRESEPQYGRAAISSSFPLALQKVFLDGLAGSCKFLCSAVLKP